MMTSENRKGPGRPDRYTASEVIKAIKGSGGVVATVALRLGCSWRTARRYIDKYKTVTEAFDDEVQVVTDAARSNVISAIFAGDLPTSKWWLVKKEPETFGDKIGLDHEGEMRVVVEYYDDDLPDDISSKDGDNADQ